MGLRFRRSIKLAPGFRLNFSGSGMSLSTGARGASMTFGSRGTYLNTGIPGTGIYSRSKIGSTPRSSSTKGNAQSGMDIRVRVEDDGTVLFLDIDGNPLPPNMVNLAKRQQGDSIKKVIQSACEKINSQAEGLQRIHTGTPDPRIPPHYEPAPFEEPEPEEPKKKRHGILGFFFQAWCDRIDRQNKENQERYLSLLDKWKTDKEAFESEQQRKKRLIEHEVLTDLNAMQTVLSSSLQDLVWPRETTVAFEIIDDGSTVFLDVDLPEIEDMPNKMATAPARGYKINMKEMGKSQLQKLYANHVHGVGFRIIGEAFSVLPKAETVVLSSYSQRTDKATAQIEDQYLFSAKVSRQSWCNICFDKLDSLDVVEAFERFELRRDLTKTGIFKPIQPFQIA
jgi:hypothetical protein